MPNEKPPVNAFKKGHTKVGGRPPGRRNIRVVVVSEPTKEISNWLEKLGMSEYAQRFAENDIDLSVLPDLTDQDLRELGLSMGHRRRLLRAISDLNNPSASPNSAGRVLIWSTVRPKASRLVGSVQWASSKTHQHRSLACQFSNLCCQGFQRSLPAP